MVPIHHYGHTPKRKLSRQKDQWYLELFRKKVASDASPYSRYILGTFALQCGHLHEAREAFQAYLAVAPHDHRAYSQLACLLAGEGQFAEAVDYYLQALTLAPLDPVLHAQVGTLYLKLRRLHFAGGHFRRALALSPGIASALKGPAMVNDFKSKCCLPVRVTPG